MAFTCKGVFSLRKLLNECKYSTVKKKKKTTDGNNPYAICMLLNLECASNHPAILLKYRF